MTPAVQTIAFPSVHVGGKDHVLKFDFVAQYQAGKADLDPQQALAIITSTGGHTFAKMSKIVEMFSVCVAHEYIAAKLTPPSADEWALVINAEPKPMETLTAIARAIGEAISKAVPAPTTTPTAPAEPATPGAVN